MPLNATESPFFPKLTSSFDCMLEQPNAFNSVHVYMTNRILEEEEEDKGTPRKETRFYSPEQNDQTTTHFGVRTRVTKKHTHDFPNLVEAQCF